MLEFSRIALTIAYIGFLFSRLFSPLVAIIGIVISSVILAAMSKKIKAFYGKIESRFMENYNEREMGKANTNEILGPWDSHISRFEIEAHTPLVGKSLKELKLREHFGVNIVAINRGDYIINLPTREEHLFPHDKIAVIGTDEQLHKFEEFLDSSSSDSNLEETTHNVVLHHFTVGRSSSLVGQNIRKSEIREHSQGLVVGVERNGERILNPESDFVFEVNDIVWLVGNEKRLQEIMQTEAI